MTTRDIETARELEQLKGLILGLQTEIKDAESRLATLERWKGSCALIASSWAGVTLTIGTLFYFITAEWEKIIAFIKGRP